MNNKKIVIILMSLTIIFVTLGSTFAYLNWESNDARKTNVTFTVNTDFTCAADGGGDITNNDKILAPASCTNSTYAIKRQITTSTTTVRDKVISMDLWLNINQIDTELSNSNNFKYVLSRNGNSCTSGIITQGTFKNKHSGDRVMLLDDTEYATLNDTYYLYVWLDAAETNSNTMDKNFNFSLGGSCEDFGVEKATLKSLNTTNFFREADYKTKVTDIYFVYDEDLPSGIQNNNIKTYDMSNTTGKSITGYLIENTDQGAAPDTYKVYVSSEYKIYAGSLQNAFNGMTALRSISFNNFNTSNTTNMQGMFYDCSSLTTLDLSNFDTSNVTNMGSSYESTYDGMFGRCYGLTTLNLSSFNTSNVTNMRAMFSDCNSLASLNISSFNTSSVTDMQAMFKNCSGLTTLNLSNFNTSNVTRTKLMFHSCSGLTTLNLSSFNTSNVTDMTSMFTGCSGLTTLDLSNFNTSNVTKMNAAYYGDADGSGMFKNCNSLTYLNLSGWDTSKITNFEAMFMGCSNLNNLDLSSFDTTAGVRTKYMFDGYKGSVVYVSDRWNLSNVTDSANMFRSATNLPNFSSSSIDKTKAYYGGDGLGYLTYKAYPSS